MFYQLCCSSPFLGFLGQHHYFLRWLVGGLDRQNLSSKTIKTVVRSTFTTASKQSVETTGPRGGRTTGRGRVRATENQNRITIEK